MFVNCIMLAFYIASSLEEAEKRTFYPYMYQIFEFIKTEQTKYNTTPRPRDGDRKTLCQLVQEAMYDSDPNSTSIDKVTLFEDNTSIQNIVKTMVAMVKHYTLKGADPPSSVAERRRTPLFIKFPYRSEQGLMRQLIQNFLNDYESYRPNSSSGGLYQRREALPPMRDAAPRPGPEGVRRNPRREVRQRMEDPGAYRRLEDEDEYAEDTGA
jgi:hypothetical protein